jgi:hypothetical protein
VQRVGIFACGESGACCASRPPGHCCGGAGTYVRRTRYNVAALAVAHSERRRRNGGGWLRQMDLDRLKSLGIIVLLALAAFAYGLYADVTLTRCVRGSVSSALGLCAKGD